MRGVGAGLAALAPLGLTACGSSAGAPVTGRTGVATTAARVLRRAYDGAPPVIPHDGFSRECRTCHTAEGLAVGRLGYAPPSPHGKTPGLAGGRCAQCHVSQVRAAVWRTNGFVGVRHVLRRGRRLDAGTPPTIPHHVFMREACAACHTGPAARESVRMRHPDRGWCRQCHVPVATRQPFRRTSGL